MAQQDLDDPVYAEELAERRKVHRGHPQDQPALEAEAGAIAASEILAFCNIADEVLFLKKHKTAVFTQETPRQRHRQCAGKRSQLVHCMNDVAQENEHKEM